MSIEEPSTDSPLRVCREVAVSWAPVLHALGHPDRLLIVLWLANQSCSVRELEAATGLAQSLVSYHLAGLRDAGLVRAVAEGRKNRYRLTDPDLDGLADVIGRHCVIDPAAPEPPASPTHGDGFRRR